LPEVTQSHAGEGDASARSPESRAGDHAAIDRLAAELLPALVAKLAATDLGEIEVREGAWRVRLRRPAGGVAAPAARRASDRPSRTQPGHEGHGHAPGALEGHRSARPAAAHSTNGASPDGRRAAGPGADEPADHAPAADPHRAVATSPAVGVFHPGPDIRPGARVRGGDRIGSVDLLGVPQDVVAPADGVVAGILVEAGDAVEYGQDLIAVELMTRSGGGGA
jgi:pyruvate dehydrogenase E2 component (dihydrolipoamide acetyltransferase)